MILAAKAPTGLPCPPLFGTPRSPDRPTLGGQLAAVAQRLGKPLMAHQRHIADVALELDPATGLLAYDQVVVIGPRQATGKTELLLPMLTHRCVGFDRRLTDWIRQTLGVDPPEPGPQRVSYTAQTADKAREKWRDVHVARLQQSVYRNQFTPRLRLNQEAMMWRNGSMWTPLSTTGKTAGTGDTLDVGVIDEAWSRPDAKTELGLRPAMMTRDWRQLWVMSMIPGLSRALPGTWRYLQTKRQVGRAKVNAGVRHGMAFFDFTAPRHLDPADPATWWTCMPGLGHTVAERVVASDFANCHTPVDLVDFCAEYLGWEPDPDTKPRWTVIRETTWNDRYDPTSQIVGRPAFALEFSQDRTRARIGAAGRRGDGHWHVEKIEPGWRVDAAVQGISWAVPRLLEMAAKQEPLTVVIDPSRPARSEIPALRNAGIHVTTPNQGDIAGACGRFYDRTGEDDDTGELLFHLGQKELADALAETRKWDHGNGAFTFVSKHDDADLGDLYVCVLAMHGAEVCGEEPEVEPDIFFGGDDIDLDTFEIR